MCPQEFHGYEFLLLVQTIEIVVRLGWFLLPLLILFTKIFVLIILLW